MRSISLLCSPTTKVIIFILLLFYLQLDSMVFHFPIITYFVVFLLIQSISVVRGCPPFPYNIHTGKCLAQVGSVFMYMSVYMNVCLCVQ